MYKTALCSLVLFASQLAWAGTVTQPVSKDELLFMSNRSGGLFELYRMAADGSGVQRVLADHREASGMSWSPDGSKVIYTTTPAGGQLNVYVTSVVDGQSRQLTHDELPSSQPTWSPDGKTIAFVSSRGGVRKIYLMDADGKRQRRLTRSTNDDEFAPRFSPDGAAVAYLASGEHIGPPRVAVADLPSGKSGVVSANAERAIEASPAWSPDGRQLLFNLIKGQTNHLFVMAADGSDRKQLTGIDQTLNGQAQWSPDGHQILYLSVSPATARQELHLMKANGSEPRQLYGSANNVMDARWSTDGQQIFFTEHLPTGGKIFSIDLAGHAIQRLSGNEGFDLNIHVCCATGRPHTGSALGKVVP